MASRRLRGGASLPLRRAMIPGSPCAVRLLMLLLIIFHLHLMFALFGPGASLVHH